MIKKKKYYVYMHLYEGRPVYIGKGSVDYNKCKYGYDDRAKRFNNRNQRYTNFVKEVGKENIEIKIIARFDDESEAIWLENELHDVHHNLYSLSDRQVAKLNAERPRHKKAVVQLTLDGEFIREYKSTKDAIGYRASSINLCCNKKLISHRGYRWLFADEYYSGNYWFKKKKIYNTKGNGNIPIVVISKDNIYYFDSHKECKRQLGFYSKDIEQSHNKYSKKYDLFVLKQNEYNNETYDELIYKYKIGIVQLDRDYKLIKHYMSLSKVDGRYNITKISDCINKKRKHHRNYLWFTLEEYLDVIIKNK